MLNDPCKPKITILFTAKNYAIIRDNITEYIWLYSYNKPIAYHDGKQFRKFDYAIKTDTNKKHYGTFKTRLTEFFKHGNITN